MWRWGSPPIPQACPNCKSLNGSQRFVNGSPVNVSVCYSGYPETVGVVMVCLDCGTQFYALRSGMVERVGGRVVRPDAPVKDNVIPMPRRPIGVDDMQTQDTLPEDRP